MSDMPELFDKRDALNKQVRELIQERNAIKDAFNNQMREFNAHLAEVRAIKNQKYQLERAARQAEWESRQKVKEAEKEEETPFLYELTQIENTVAFLKGLMP